MPLSLPALGRQRQSDLCEFEASVVYRARSRTARATQRNLVSINKQTNKIHKHNHNLTATEEARWGHIFIPREASGALWV